MTALELLRRLDAEATPGPWVSKWATSSDVWAGREMVADCCGVEPSNDAHAIATLRTLLPELIAVVDTARDASERGYAADHHDARRALDALDAKAAELVDE